MSEWRWTPTDMTDVPSLAQTAGLGMPEEDFTVMGVSELAKGMRLKIKVGGEWRVVEIADIQEGERGTVNLTVDTIPALYEGGWRFYGDPT